MIAAKLITQIMENLKYTLLVPCCLLLAACGTRAEEPYKHVDCTGWTTAEISLSGRGSDYSLGAKRILLQCLDAKRVILSFNGPRSNDLPVALAEVDTDAARKILDQAVAFYDQAHKEPGGHDPSASDAASTDGPGTIWEVTIALSRGRDIDTYQYRFSPQSAALIGLGKLVEQQEGIGVLQGRVFTRP